MRTADIAYIVEGDDLYYYLTDIKNKNYENIYPAPVVEVAARFRLDWVLNDGSIDEVPFTFEQRIRKAQKDPEFQLSASSKKNYLARKDLNLNKRKAVFRYSLSSFIFSLFLSFFISILLEAIFFEVEIKS
jgi:hypothetical protein